MQTETPRITVVTHDPDFHAQVSRILGQRLDAPLRLGPGLHGLDALRGLPSQQLFLLDCRENPDGENAYEKLRRLVGLGRGPVALVLQEPGQVAREVARSLGAAGVLGTPLERAELLALCPPQAPFSTAPARNIGSASALSGARPSGPTTAAGQDQDLDTLKLPAALLAELADQDPRHASLIDALIDPETSLFNFEFLSFKLDEEYKRARRFGLPLSCVMLGFDGECEEDVLRRLAAVFLDASRDTDVLGRFDRSTFLFLLPNTDPVGAQAMIARVQTSVARLELRDVLGDPLELSVGLSSWPSPGVERPSDLYRRSREALTQRC